jgi:hypothetical protein
MKTALKWIASVALLGAGLYLLDWPVLAAAAAKLTPWAFLVAVLLASATMLPLFARWHSLTGGADGWYLCGARYLYANLLNAVSPGSLGGDVYRFFAFRTPDRSGATLAAILVRERVFGLTSMLIGLVVGAAAAEFAGTYPGQALALQYVARRLGFEIPWSLLLVVVTSVELVRIVPLTIQGIGVREGAFASLLGLFGHAPENGFVLGAVAYLALSVSLVVTGGLGAVLLGLRRESRSGIS